MEEKTRKPDRRTQKTKEIIKLSLLKIMEKKSFSKISVTEICQHSNINRGTFYLHYFDLNDVLDEILEEIISSSSSVIDHVLCPERLTGKCGYPFCEIIHTRVVYRPIFLDDSVAGPLIEKVAELGKEKFVTWLMSHSVLTFEEAEAVFYFQMNGCLAINRTALKNHCTDWHKIQRVIDQFIKAGLESYLIR